MARWCSPCRRQARSFRRLASPPWRNSLLSGVAGLKEKKKGQSVASKGVSSGFLWHLLGCVSAVCPVFRLACWLVPLCCGRSFRFWATGPRWNLLHVLWVLPVFGASPCLLPAAMEHAGQEGVGSSLSTGSLWGVSFLSAVLRCWRLQLPMPFGVLVPLVPLAGVPDLSWRLVRLGVLCIRQVSENHGGGAFIASLLVCQALGAFVALCTT